MSIFEDIGKAVGQFAPMLGSALLGPLGGAAGNIVAKALGVDTGDSKSIPAGIKDAIAGISPEQRAALEKAEQDFTLQMAALGYKDIESLNALAGQNATDINTTMQAEAKSEHWMTYSWRPAVGFSVAIFVVVIGLTICASYIYAMATGKSEALQYIPGMLTSTAAFMAMVTPVVGIASWFRGKMQASQASDGTGS